MGWVWGILFVSFGAQAAGTWAPPQLHPRRFAACLKKDVPTASLKTAAALGTKYSFNKLDLFLLHLAVYPGTQVSAVTAPVQSRARKWWGDNWDAYEKLLAQRMERHAQAAKTTVPRHVFREALALCHGKDFFCAALISHNVLRTLGRHQQGVYQSGWTGWSYDYNPAWFKGDRARWIQAASDIEQSLIPLRSDGLGDKWGEWYHVFGILAYGVHEAAAGKAPTSIEFVVRMNELLNPWLAGGDEGAEKARVDRDAIEVAQWFLTDTKTPPPTVDCDAAETYTAAEWGSTPDPFPLTP